jgi:protein-L-isoaspartate(D-aspartate) O-methyltransferase
MADAAAPTMPGDPPGRGGRIEPDEAESPESVDPSAEADRVAVAGFLLRLRRFDITDRRIMAAIEGAPRGLFVPPHARRDAYAERPLPIDCGQTMTGPEIVARAVSDLEVEEGDRVLEIGTGTGYQTAILVRLAEKVFTVDRFRTLIEAAERRFTTLRLDNIVTRTEDGAIGWPEEAPFDRIIVNVSVEKIPKALYEQLKVGGLMLIPVGEPSGVQRLMRVERDAKGWEERPLREVRFVPLIPGRAARL